MGCVNSHPLNHPKKPLPIIPQTSINHGPNGVVSNSSKEIDGERSNSIVSSNQSQLSNDNYTNGNNKTASGGSSQTSNQNESSIKLKKKKFLGTWGKKSKFARSPSVASSTTSNSSETQQQTPRPPLPTPPSTNQANNQKVVIALYGYEGRDEGELSFEKNDKLIIVDDSEPDWWLAYKITAPDRRGYIPMNFVVNNVIETEE